MSPKTSFRVLLISYGEVWSAQAVDFNIASQGGTMEDAIRNFENLMVDQRCLDEEAGREFLAGVPPAPEVFEQAWEKAAQVVNPAPWTDMPPMIAAQQIRVANSAVSC